MSSNEVIMNLWLDDTRIPNDDSRPWTHCTNTMSAINLSEEMISTGKKFTVISVDHDLGINSPGGDGINYLKWLIENQFWPIVLNFHTQNMVGRKNMLEMWANSDTPNDIIVDTNTKIIAFINEV